MAPDPERHHWAAVKQENGEVQEDVVEESELQPTSADSEAESEESFPASDPPSDWAGPDTLGPDEHPERIVDSAPLGEVAERDHPADSRPGTLPRN